MKKYIIALITSAATFPSQSAIELSENFSISGFGSTSWTKSDNSTPLLVNRNIADENCLDCDTTLGVQFDYYLDVFKASLQVVKRPQDHWSEPQIEWAYAGYAFDVINTEVRAGRLRLPVFLASEYYYVGHAYTTARPPEEVYNSILGVTAYNGISAIWNYDIADEIQLSVTPFAGFNDTNEVEFDSYLSLEFETKSMWGANIQLSGEYYRWNLSYLDSKFDMTTIFQGFRLPSVEESTRLYSLGAEYDIAGFKLTAEGQTNDLSSAWYGSLAYRIDEITPYAVYGQQFNGDRDKTGASYTLGVRYDLFYNVSLNGEWQNFDAYGGERGAFVSIPNPSNTDANLYTVLINFVF
ncbi:porin [Vibrio sp. ZSDZ34]|uniref:Porin n=1 Tax=Vibrio gelatinilyticus TaxID=2893468 RepID=A0A9X1WC66_9VIBR|nr:porin [Vibrio gelatinilyticus]MCJ2377611.1 porin [Vibrio gelatinilyticus]